MQKVPALFLVMVIALSLCGCISSPSPAATSSPTATAAASATAAPVQIIYIGGVVLDPRGAPVPDARVALWQGDQLVSDPESIQNANSIGRFNFTNLQPAHYQITADIQGHQGLVDRRFNDSTSSIEIVIPGYTVPSVTPAASQGPAPANMPQFTVTRLDANTIEVHLTSFGGVTTLKGFYVKSPYITTPEVLAVDKPLGESWTAQIQDPNLRGTVHFVASSWVNGNYAEVINTTV